MHSTVPEMGQLSERDAKEADSVLQAMSADERKHLVATYEWSRRAILIPRAFTKHGERLQSLGLAVPVGDAGWIKRRTTYMLSIWGALVAAHALRTQEPA